MSYVDNWITKYGNTHLHNNSHSTHALCTALLIKGLYFHSAHLIQQLCNLIKDYVPFPKNNIWLGILGGAY
jgi:hypothetical protein